MTMQILSSVDTVVTLLPTVSPSCMILYTGGTFGNCYIFSLLMASKGATKEVGRGTASLVWHRNMLIILLK